MNITDPGIIDMIGWLKLETGYSEETVVRRALWLLVVAQKAWSENCDVAVIEDGMDDVEGVKLIITP